MPLEHAIDDTLRTTPTEWPDLYSSLVLHSRRGRNGCGRLRAVLDERFGDKVITDSWFEKVVRRLLLDAGFPEGRRHSGTSTTAPCWSGSSILRGPAFKVGAELQSKAHHLNPTSFEKDPQKLNKIRLLGWIVLEFTWNFYKAHPEQLLCPTPPGSDCFWRPICCGNRNESAQFRTRAGMSLRRGPDWVRR